MTFCVSLQRTLYTHIYIYDVRAVQTSSSKPQSTLVPPCLHPFNQSSCYFKYSSSSSSLSWWGIYYRHHCPNTCMSLLAHLSKYPNVIAETATLTTDLYTTLGVSINHDTTLTYYITVLREICWSYTPKWG